MRHTKGAFVVTGNDIEARTFGSRREAKDWCADHYPFSNKGDRAGRRQEPTQKPGHRAMIRLEQRGAVAFTFMGIAVALILLITVWEYLLSRTTRRLLGCSTNPRSFAFWRTSSSPLHRKLAVCANVSP
jgi:hypothetical protein